MTTPLKPNGSTSSFHIEWTLAQRWLAGILAAFVVAGTMGTLALHVRVAVIETQVEYHRALVLEQIERLDEVEQRQANHKDDTERHENASAKVMRILEVGSKIREDHEKDMHEAGGK